MRLPEEIRKGALTYAYRVFDNKRWEQLPSRERGVVYDELIADERFSAPLRPYATAAQIRVWLKDSAAKEYQRALEGIGTTAGYTRRRYPGSDTIVYSVLGPEWRVVSDSIKQKPMRCLVVNDAGEQALLTWGSLKGLRDLYFAASAAKVAGEKRVLVVITRPTMSKPSKEDWERVVGFCSLIGAEAHSVMYSPRAVF